MASFPKTLWGLSAPPTILDMPAGMTDDAFHDPLHLNLGGGGGLTRVLGRAIENVASWGYQ